jgi:hypothetical protein
VRLRYKKRGNKKKYMREEGVDEWKKKMGEE